MSFRASDVFFLILIITYMAWYCHQSRSILEQWAKACGYKLLRVRRSFRIGGPFFWRTSKAQTVFHVRLYDPGLRRIRRAWVRCGGFWSGMSSDEVEVRWEEHSVTDSLPVGAVNDRAAVGSRPTLIDYLDSHWIKAGLALVVLGWEPLWIIILLAGIGLWPDSNPNPIGPGILFFLTAWPAIICLVIGTVRVRRNYGK
jgi:hypothetical protein